MWVVSCGQALHSWCLSVWLVTPVTVACACTGLCWFPQMCAHCHSFCLHSTAFIVVWGAGTALAASPPEKPAERSSREAAHATPHELYELHETHPLSQVSLGPARSSALRTALCDTSVTWNACCHWWGGNTVSCPAQHCRQQSICDYSKH